MERHRHSEDQTRHRAGARGLRRFVVLSRNRSSQGLHHSLRFQPSKWDPHRRAPHREPVGLYKGPGRLGGPLYGWDRHDERRGREGQRQGVGLHRSFRTRIGETQGALITKFPGSEVKAVSVGVPYTKADGTQVTDLYLSEAGQAAFAADIPTARFRILQATQRPFDADSFIYPTKAAAWRTIPSWGLVAGRDKAIPPECERWMYSRANARKVVEVPTSSHVAMISHPMIVADLIDEAATDVS